MEHEAHFPKTLQEAILYFSNLDTCTTFMAQIRWPEGVTCPNCEGKAVSYLSTRFMWKCKACKKQFSVKQGTVMEDSPIGLDKWLAAMWLISNAKNGISSCAITRALGVTPKSAWFPSPPHSAGDADGNLQEDGRHCRRRRDGDTLMRQVFRIDER